MADPTSLLVQSFLNTDHQSSSFHSGSPTIDSTLEPVCSLIVLMAQGKWSRWGCGACEGYNLSIGPVRDLHGQVARNVGTPVTWRATVSGHDEKIFPDRESAMAHVEREIRIAMGDVLRDWNIFCAARGLTPIGTPH